MLVMIDWISFSVPIETIGLTDDRDVPEEVNRACNELHPNLGDWLDFAGSWEARKGRAPYSTSFANKDAGITVFVNSALPHALIEISGQGCAYLRDTLGTDADVLNAVQSRLTRLDIACDIATQTEPIEFAEMRDTKRFKAHSYVHSEAGSTFYVGSKTSDRYARVYRYKHPHPRHNLLRVEYVIKAENAKLTARAVLQAGLFAVVSKLGSDYGWKHGDWKITDNAAELKVYRPERKEGKTVYWLSDTVAPLLVRLHKDGILDVNQWLYDMVLQKLQD